MCVNYISFIFIPLILYYFYFIYKELNNEYSVKPEKQL